MPTELDELTVLAIDEAMRKLAEVDERKGRLVELRFFAGLEEITQRHGHSSLIYCLAFSPDGQTLASGGGDDTVRLWPLTPYCEQWQQRHAQSGKGGRSRTVGIDPGGITMLQKWIDVRTSLWLTGMHPLICTVRGNRLTEAYVRRLLPKLGRQAGIAKRVHAHGLRHTHAAELRAEGVDIGIISKQLGHRSIATTARYLDHIAPFAVVDAISTRKWPIADGFGRSCCHRCSSSWPGDTAMDSD